MGPPRLFQPNPERLQIAGLPPAAEFVIKVSPAPSTSSPQESSDDQEIPPRQTAFTYPSENLDRTQTPSYKLPAGRAKALRRNLLVVAIQPSTQSAGPRTFGASLDVSGAGFSRKLRNTERKNSSQTAVKDPVLRDSTVQVLRWSPGPPPLRKWFIGEWFQTSLRSNSAAHTVVGT
jgi:hypothetical protein